MKFYKIIILICIIFFSCVGEKQELKQAIIIEEIHIPTIEKKNTDVNFSLKNGTLHYEEKPFSGVVKEFYADGNLKTISQYYQGKRQGRYIGYYPNEKKWFERFYEKGIKTGKHKGWFNNDQQMFEYQFNNKGFYNGSVKDWHRNGQLAKHFNFVNGKESGSQKMWKIDGKIRANFFTINGERHGLIGLKNCVSVLK